jgi:GNAT superfamily N-acetyltransferase
LNTENVEIHIRHGSRADNVLLAEMGRVTFYDSFAEQNTPENMAAYLAASFSPEIQAAELDNPGSLFLIAEVNNTPAGYARLHTAPAGQLLPAGVTGTHPVELVRIYARKEWIGKGIGAALMKACLEEAAARGHDVIWLGVWEHNPRAIHFYQKWGFRVVGSQIFQLGDDPQHDLVMQRSLADIET